MSGTATAAASDREIRLNTTGELRLVKAGEKTTMVGYAAVYDQRSLPIFGMFVEIVRRGAFARALRGEDDVCAFNGHDSTRVLGRNKAGTLRLSDDAHGLKIECDLPPTQDARDLAVSIDRGDITQMSFGFRKIQDRWSEEKTAEGIVYEVRELLDVNLFDISPVAFGQYPQTEVGLRGRDAALRSREAWREVHRGADPMRLARLRLAEAEG